MTINEKHDIIYKELLIATEAFLKSYNVASEIGGFAPFTTVPSYLRDEKAWQIATNNYTNFIKEIKGKNFHEAYVETVQVN